MRRARAILIASLACLALASPAAAAKPQMERVVLNDIGLQDDFLTDACGFDVFFDGTGQAIFREFTDSEGNLLRELNNFGVHVRVYSEWGSVSLVDVGVDRVTYNADGSITQVIIGNVQSIHLPGQGRVYADVGQTTLMITFPDPEGDPVVELVRQVGQHSDFGQEDVLCEALAA